MRLTATYLDLAKPGSLTKPTPANMSLVVTEKGNFQHILRYV